MKTKYAVALVTIGLVVAASLFAAEQNATKGPTRTLLLKANGEAVAQLTLLTQDTLEISGAPMVMNATTGILTAKGDNLTIGVSRQGKLLPITIKANEAEMVSQ